MVDLKDVDREEYERRKRAIFESMSKRGQQRILKMGYENWDPFVEPKDPRERLVSDPARQAVGLLVKFYETSKIGELARTYHRELFDLANGLIRGEAKARVIFAFVKWYEEEIGQKGVR
ncbi:hypothetical protein [Thermodesulforhabdus norvegica]|uniref:Uncharacterized protein n=1 Tax=Thermodesulforhabdus norvegica TaxID=39841 RepID=A0A1I4SD66_9BACT|nr:hypothetical protein [Thermodesulforhabdus norvegica]SFM62261.1 hypothetical protein SAMN05660836_00891 [Thermodesulforhabdus norvegica]